MRRAVMVVLVIMMLAGLLTACLPAGGSFGYPEKQPRPEFSGSPMAPAAEIQEMEE